MRCIAVWRKFYSLRSSWRIHLRKDWEHRTFGFNQNFRERFELAFFARALGRVGSQRVIPINRGHFSNCPPPNRTWPFPYHSALQLKWAYFIIDIIVRISLNSRLIFQPSQPVPLRPVNGFPALPGRTLLPQLLLELRHLVGLPI